MGSSHADAQKHHPDTGGTSESSRATYAAVSDAYEMLRDENTRRSLSRLYTPPSSSDPTGPNMFHRAPNPTGSARPRYNAPFRER